MTDEFVTNYLDNKIKLDEKYVRCSYFDLRVKNNLTQDEINEFYKMGKKYLEKNDYKVYSINEQYYFNGKMQIVQSNEIMIGIKNNEGM